MNSIIQYFYIIYQLSHTLIIWLNLQLKIEYNTYVNDRLNILNFKNNSFSGNFP